MSTAIDWPSTLPGFTRGSWSYREQMSVLKTQMEVGPAKRRLRSTVKVPLYSGTLELDEAEVAIYRTFVETTLNNGILSFNFPDFVNNTTVEAVLSLETNDDIVNLKQTGLHTYQVDVKIEGVPS